MFYEDISIGQVLAVGEVTFSREAILAYGRLFDPRIVAQADDGGTPLAASGLHVAAAGMRRLVDTRSALRAAMAERDEVLPQLGVSPGSQTCAGLTRFMRATSFSILWRLCRSARPPSRNGAWLAIYFAA